MDDFGILCINTQHSLCTYHHLRSNCCASQQKPSSSFSFSLSSLSIVKDHYRDADHKGATSENIYSLQNPKLQRRRSQGHRKRQNM